MVRTSGVYSMLVGDHLPELGTDLVTALTTLNMDDFTHIVLCKSTLLLLLNKCAVWSDSLVLVRIGNGFRIVS